jgi:CheY-like chemotaxis protein
MGLLSFLNRRTWPQLEFDEIKKRSRLLVVDDNDFPYEVLFKRDGYNLEKWSDIDDLPKIESNYYDILLLDMQGIGRQQSTQQGLGILKHIRTSTPAQIVVAYSSAEFDLSAQEFFDMADAVLLKSSDYVDFKRKVDELLIQRFSLGFYIGRITAVAGTHTDDRNKLEREAKKAILEGDPQRLRLYLASKITDPQVIQNALSVVSIGMKVMDIWKS